MADLAEPRLNEDFEGSTGAEIQWRGRPRIELDDQRVHREVGVALPRSVKVNGIELTADTPLTNLRAACSFYSIGQEANQNAMDVFMSATTSWSCC